MIETGDIWLGPESGLIDVCNKLEAYNKGIQAGTIQYRANYQQDEEIPNPVGYDVVGSVGIISVKGSMITSSSFFSRLFGVPSYQDIKERLLEAAEDYDVKGTVLRLDSPGGAERGAKTSANFIRNFNNKVKPVVSFTEDTMASAAYWLGSGASKITADPDARVGSIGALMIHTEYTEMLKAEGIKKTVFRSAPYKALGTPFEKLSDKAEEEINTFLMQSHNKFVDGISELRRIDRNTVAQKVANGKVYSAEDSLKLGMVDNLMPFEELIAKLDAAFNKGSAAARPATR